MCTVDTPTEGDHRHRHQLRSRWCNPGRRPGSLAAHPRFQGIRLRACPNMYSTARTPRRLGFSAADLVTRTDDNELPQAVPPPASGKGHQRTTKGGVRTPHRQARKPPDRWLPEELRVLYYCAVERVVVHLEGLGQLHENDPQYFGQRTSRNFGAWPERCRSVAPDRRRTRQRTGRAGMVAHPKASRGPLSYQPQNGCAPGTDRKNRLHYHSGWAPPLPSQRNPFPRERSQCSSACVFRCRRCQRNALMSSAPVSGASMTLECRRCGEPDPPP